MPPLRELGNDPVWQIEIVPNKLTDAQWRDALRAGEANVGFYRRACWGTMAPLRVPVDAYQPLFDSLGTLDLSVDPYDFSTTPPEVKGIEGIPEGNFDTIRGVVTDNITRMTQDVIEGALPGFYFHDRGG